MKTKYGYALVHRRGIVAALEHEEPTRYLYCIFTTKKDAVSAQKDAPHCRVVRVRIEVAEL